MRPFQKRYLILSSFCFCLFLFSCKIAKYQSKGPAVSEKLTYEKLLPVANPYGKSSKYKATIDVLNKHFSGIVIVKKTDSVSTHVVFITELGMKMFDFEKKDADINAVFVFEPLNKPKLVSVLKNNFKNMLLLDAYDKEVKTGTTHNKQKVYELLNRSEKRYFVVSEPNQLATQAIFYKRRYL